MAKKNGLTAGELLAKLQQLISSGEVPPDAEVTIGHYTKSKEGLIEDLYLWGVDWIWSAPIDNGETEKILEIEAYNEPLM